MTNADRNARGGIVAVTGASRGIGAAIAIELATRGYTVGCLSRRGEGPEQMDVPGDIAVRMINHRFDLDDPSSLAPALAALDREPGGLRHLVNNAGVYASQVSEKLANDEFERLLRTNVVGTFAMCREAYPILRRRGGGTIVNIGSFFDRIGAPQNVAYSASKAAIGALTRTLAVEWARDGIVLINIAPGYIETDLNKDYLARDDVRAFFARRVPIARPGRPEEVASLIAALLGEDLSLLSGETIYADGGHSIDHGRI